MGPSEQFPFEEHSHSQQVQLTSRPYVDPCCPFEPAPSESGNNQRLFPMVQWQPEVHHSSPVAASSGAARRGRNRSFSPMDFLHADHSVRLFARDWAFCWSTAVDTQDLRSHHHPQSVIMMVMSLTLQSAQHSYRTPVFHLIESCPLKCRILTHCTALQTASCMIQQLLRTLGSICPRSKNLRGRWTRICFEMDHFVHTQEVHSLTMSGQHIWHRKYQLLPACCLLTDLTICLVKLCSSGYQEFVGAISLEFSLLVWPSVGSLQGLLPL